MKKRGSKNKREIKIILSNRWLYTLITIGIIALIGVGVYAATYIASGAGHPYTEISTCGANQILKMSGGVWTCQSDATGSDGTNCPAGQYAQGVDANGNAQGCTVDATGITSESDPQVGAVTNGKWCVGDGSAVQCNQNKPFIRIQPIEGNSLTENQIYDAFSPYIDANTNEIIKVYPASGMLYRDWTTGVRYIVSAYRVSVSGSNYISFQDSVGASHLVRDAYSNSFATFHAYILTDA